MDILTVLLQMVCFNNSLFDCKTVLVVFVKILKYKEVQLYTKEFGDFQDQ